MRLWGRCANRTWKVACGGIFESQKFEEEKDPQDYARFDAGSEIRADDLRLHKYVHTRIWSKRARPDEIRSSKTHRLANMRKYML